MLVGFVCSLKLTPNDPAYKGKYKIIHIRLSKDTHQPLGDDIQPCLFFHFANNRFVRQLV